MTNELREALVRSEGVRQALARSYADAAIQTEALEKSERQLSELATKLERSNSELKTVNEELKSFAYIISHDLRTPLINLKGFAAELRSAVDIIRPVVRPALRQADKDQKQAVRVALDEDVPEALEFIDASVTRMEHFINAILKLSRLGRRELNFEPLDMDALVRATLQTLAHRLEQRRVKVTVGSLPSVVADRLALEQIMSNILTNAVDYLEPNRSGVIAIAGQRREDETIFYIRDNGRGIAAENMPKVFEPFRRIGKLDTPGEGMGLAYVQTLVRRHGGRIWCESEVAVGTTFIFTLSNHLKEGEHDA
jgi:signal transduction histidine kinase